MCNRCMERGSVQGEDDAPEDTGREQEVGAGKAFSMPTRPWTRVADDNVQQSTELLVNDRRSVD